MFKGERKRSGLNMDLRSNFENRLKANAFLTNVSLGVSFRRLTSTTYGSNIALIKAILVRVNDDFMFIDSKS